MYHIFNHLLYDNTLPRTRFCINSGSLIQRVVRQTSVHEQTLFEAEKNLISNFKFYWSTVVFETCSYFRFENVYICIHLSNFEDSGS